MSTKRKLLLSTLSLPLVVFVGAHVLVRVLVPPVRVPEYESVNVVWLDQNWTSDDWQWFYHASQGGSMELPIPYVWLTNFEVPDLPFFIFTEVGRLMDRSYVARFGFLPDPVTSYDPDSLSNGWAVAEPYSTLAKDGENNPAKAPVGFVRTRDYPDRRYNGGEGRVADMVGFTCAACHTGQLNYQGTGIRIEGGSAMTDLGKFKKAVGRAMFLTWAVPTRFNRFADKVLEPGYGPSQKADLKFWLKDLIDRGGALKGMLEERGIYPTEESFSRLDAVGRIGNYVLGAEISWVNYSVSDAPVNYPHIWDTPWFEWVQYNGSFKQPMMRNAGEAMGVFAAVNFDDIDDPDSLFASTLNMTNLHELESLIRGREPYTGLWSPEWPDSILGEIDQPSADRGDWLYGELCARCHLPPMTDAVSFYGDDFWVEDQGLRYLKLNLVNLFTIGTDPNTAENMMARVVQLGALGEKFKDDGAIGGLDMGGVVRLVDGLPLAISAATNKRYDDLEFPDSLREAFNGRRSEPYMRTPLAYKARPLNGVWASPPFLHNGSVPNLYQLLGPEEERDSTFWLGTKEYDPVLLGYARAHVQDGFLFDTSRPGNSNRGHHFTGGTDSWREGRKGVIGRALTPAERMDLIEFLKSLPSVPGGRPR